MAQSNISITNKTGYSMFWNSMWDSKNSYSRNFKEDVFLKVFFKFAFTDSLSVNTISFKNNKKIMYKKYSQFLDINNKDLMKYYINMNKLNSYVSKIWILKYQKWLIIYSFVFINNFSGNSVLNSVIKLENNYNSNFFYLYKNFLKAEKNNQLSYFNCKKSKKFLNF